jgi:hypothetical protein
VTRTEGSAFGVGDALFSMTQRDCGEPVLRQEDAGKKEGRPMALGMDVSLVLRLFDLSVARLIED